MRTYKLFPLICCAIIITLSSCKNWLDIQPRQNIKSEVLFKDPEGFESALTGCYDLLQDGSLYTGGLTYGFVSTLEQRFDNPRRNRSNQQIAFIYNYKDNNGSKRAIDGIWEKSYNAIVNVNNLIIFLDKTGKEVLTPQKLESIRSEAHGLRGLLYFNLLRLWGPVYAQNPTYPTAPFRVLPDDQKIAPAPADSLALAILDDFTIAEEAYMKSINNADVQPLEDDDLRVYRMNIFAIKAMKAEVYQWIGDKEKAFKYADEVVKESGLSLVKGTRTDPVFLGETLFGLNVYKFEEKTSSIFPTNTSSVNQDNSPAYYTAGRALEDIFEIYSFGNTDIRYKYKEGFLNEGERYVLRKFMNISELTAKDVMPIVRLSNMYLIRAECGDMSDFAMNINTLRHARGIRAQFDLDPQSPLSLQEQLEILNKEYAKEYFGEGQWWYFLKRNNMTTFYRAPNDTDMSQFYIFPIPDLEKEHGLGNREEN